MKRKSPPARAARKTALAAATETATAPNAMAIAAARTALIALERADGKAEQATAALSEHLAAIWSEAVSTAVVMSLLRPGVKQRDNKSLWARVDRARVLAFGVQRAPRKPRPPVAITKEQKIEVIESWVRAVPARALAELVRKLRTESYAAALAASLGEAVQ